MWAETLGVPMHEIVIDTNTCRLTLVFHELEIRRIEPAEYNRFLIPGV